MLVVIPDTSCFSWERRADTMAPMTASNALSPLSVLELLVLVVVVVVDVVVDAVVVDPLVDT
jgi:hypothetical protein